MSNIVSPEPGPDLGAIVLAAGFRGTDQERRSFDFYCSKTARQLSGFFDTSFWERLIPQATLHEPAIRCAVLAVSSLHERFESRDDFIHKSVWNSAQGGFALKQYNHAIRQIIQPSHRRQQAADVCLVACILFACFEVIIIYGIVVVYTGSPRDRRSEDIMALRSLTSVAVSESFRNCALATKASRIQDS